MPLNQKRRHARKSAVHLPKKYAESLGYSASKIRELDRRRVAQEDKAYNEVRKAEISRRDALRQIEKESAYIDQLLKNKDLPFTRRRGLERLEGDLAKEEVKILTQTSLVPSATKSIRIAKITAINGVPVKDDEEAKLAYKAPKLTKAEIAAIADEALAKQAKELPTIPPKIKFKIVKPKKPEAEIPQSEIDRMSREMEEELRLADEAKRLQAEEGAYDLGQLFGEGAYVDGHKKSDLRRLLMSHALHQIRHHY